MLTLPVIGLFTIKLIANLKRKNALVFALKRSIPAVLTSVFIVLFCKTYGFGYMLEVPDVNDIEYACLVPSSGFHLSTYYEPQPIKESFQSLGYFESENDLTFITELHRSATDSIGKGKNYVAFQYKLKNGRTLTRTYFNISDEVAMKSLDFVDCDWFVKHIEASLGLYSTLEDHIYNWSYTYPEMIDTYLLCNNTLNKSVDLENHLTEVEIYDLKKAITDDMLNMTAEQIFKPSEQPLYYLHFYNSEYTDASPIPVYATMENTVKFLTDKSISIERVTADEIANVQYVRLLGEINSYYTYSGEYNTDGILDKTVSAAYTDTHILFNRDIIIEREWLSISDLTKKGYIPLDSVITADDEATVERLFNSHRAHYCTVGDKGALACFRLKSGGCFVTYIPECEL